VVETTEEDERMVDGRDAGGLVVGGTADLVEPDSLRCWARDVPRRALRTTSSGLGTSNANTGPASERVDWEPLFFDLCLTFSGLV
jgi:hypothetical protein